MTAPRRVPIHRALAQPPMLFGCDRNALLGLACLDAAFFMGGISRLNMPLIVFGVLFLAAGVPFLIGLAKIDARFIEVYRRSRHYAHRYSATGRWDTPPRPARKW